MYFKTSETTHVLTNGCLRAPSLGSGVTWAGEGSSHPKDHSAVSLVQRTHIIIFKLYF